MRELEQAGLVELVEARRHGNCLERVVRAAARSYIVSSEALGKLGATPVERRRGLNNLPHTGFRPSTPRYSRVLSLHVTLPASAGIAAPALATAVGLSGAALGLWLTGLRQRARVVVPFSAGVLLGVALFGLMPELAVEIGWPVSLLLFATGYGLLLAVNRFVYKVCPTCAHDHDHNDCSTPLHGFAGPLIAAAAIHSFLDGWSIATVQLTVPLGLRVAVPVAVALHKAPEGIALGGILRAAVGNRTTALGWATLAEGATLLGGVIGLSMAPKLGTGWITYPLGIAAGWLCYLGSHAIHEEWKRRGPRAAALSAAAGVAGAAAIQQGAEALFR